MHISMYVICMYVRLCMCSFRALKNSRGRTSLSIRFDSAAECQKFSSSLQTMKKFLED